MQDSKAKRLMKHLLVADSRMRELFGFYWHRRNNGITPKRLDDLTAEIREGEKVIELMKGKK